MVKDNGEMQDKNVSVFTDSEKKVRYKLKKKPIYAAIKRLFDIVLSGLFLLLFFWLYIILAIIIKVEDGGKVIYKQKRVGKNFKTIYISKFRSMEKGADALKDSLSDEQREEYYKEFKLEGDTRITKIGKFLRKTSLDELPQVFDVFIGKISLVGPRPVLDIELKMKYGDDSKKYVAVKPGLTGWWAVNGRNQRTYESGERQKLELYYVDNRSLWLDFKIIIKTFGAVLKKKGAK